MQNFIHLNKTYIWAYPGSLQRYIRTVKKNKLYFFTFFLHDHYILPEFDSFNDFLFSNDWWKTMHRVKEENW